MMKSIMAAALMLSATAAAQQSPPPEVELWRLDCGTILIKDFNAFFSDAHDYTPGPREITDSCYLIRHKDHYLLWDSGLPAALAQKPADNAQLTARLSSTLADQLKRLNLTPADIDVVGISHSHFDHTGQAAVFPNARLVVGKGDFEQTVGKDDPFGPWRRAGAKVDQATKDVDIFGDGSVIAMHTPGHTPNHLVLLVKLASGPVLLSGDQYHFTEAVKNRGVPSFNINRADTLASHDRFDRIAANTKAKVIIQHEPADVAKLPAFPQSAK